MVRVKRPVSKVRQWIGIVGVCGMLLGMGSFLGQGLIAFGTFGSLRHIAFPVGATDAAVRLADGGYAVPLRHIGRVQVYSSNLTFLYGWHVPTSGGVFTLLGGQDRRLEIYVARGQKHYVTDYAGQILQSRVYDFKSEPRSVKDPNSVALVIPSPWWAFPFRGPFYAWISGIIGILMTGASTSKKERAAQKRRPAIRREWMASTAIGKAGKTVVEWLAAAVWAGVGLVWFFSVLGLEINLVVEHNVLGAIVVIPFLLIGIVLLYVSLTIIKCAFDEITQFVRRRF